MHELLKHHTPLSGDRRQMPLALATRIMDPANTAPLADKAAINLLVEHMGEPDRIDGWETVQQLTHSLGDAYDLYWGDLKLLRVCLGNEHAAAVFDGNEIDYTPLFYDKPEILKIMRLTALLQDVGKVPCVTLTGNNFAQSSFNISIAQKIVDCISDEQLSPVAKRAVVALVGLDVIGGILQGHDVDEKLAHFMSQWPEELEEFKEDLMLSSYLSDASAHSKYRLYRNARNGFVEPAVQEDDAQLSFLFEKHRNGAVTLTPDRCEVLLSRFPGVTRLRHLLNGDRSPYAREDDVFAEVVSRKARAHPLRDPQDNGDELVYILQASSQFGPSVNTLTYPHHRPSIALEERYWLPGDGRVWHRAIWAGTVPLDGYGPSPQSYTHTDPTIAKMQKHVLIADQIQASNIGKPSSPKDAWTFINLVENLF